MRRSGKYTALITLFVLIILQYACERIEPADNSGTGDPFVSVKNPEYQHLDTTWFSYIGRLDQMYIFEFKSSLDLPSAGDLIYYFDSEFQVFAKVKTASTDANILMLDLEQEPINSLFNYLSLKIQIDENKKSEIHFLNPMASQSSDTVSFLPQELLWNLGNGKWGLLKLDSLLVFNELSGTQQYFMGPVWNDGVGTRRFELDLNQNQYLTAKVNLITQGEFLVKDSLKIRSRRIGPYFTDSIPVYYDVDEWLGIYINSSGNSVSEGRITLNSTTSAHAGYQLESGWKITNGSAQGNEFFEMGKWDKLKNKNVSLSLNTKFTPVFCGLPGIEFILENNVKTSTSIDWPDWEFQLNNDIDFSLHLRDGFFSDLPKTEFFEKVLARQIIFENGQLANQAPVPAFTVDPVSGFTDTNFTFNAGDSWDAEDPTNRLEIRWDFNGDENWDTNFSLSKQITHFFLIPGNYMVVLEVRDTEGLTAQLSKKVNVQETTSAPNASFTVTPESGRVSDVFAFDASGCWDKEDDLSLLKVRWDYDGNDVWDTPFITAKTAVYPYREPGTYYPKLQVLDTQGLTGSTSRIVEVKAANIKPTAFFTALPEFGTIQTNFSFDASGSSDPEDEAELLQVRWDFENDGVYNTEYRTIKTINHVFPVAANYTVVLQVLDTDGFSNTFTRKILVSNPNTAPKADYTISPTSGDTTTLFTFDASISSDLEDGLENLLFRWDWENDDVYDTEFSSSAIIQRTFNEAKTYLIKLQVKDSGGLMHTKTRYVIVE